MEDVNDLGEKMKIWNCENGKNERDGWHLCKILDLGSYDFLSGMSEVNLLLL